MITKRNIVLWWIDMNQEMLCTWLGLPKTAWPPDAWTLLGLPRDVQDMKVIEKRVQDRMCQLRNYQLSYPEEATEGMNRLAEAFITLTETCNKTNSSVPRTATAASPKKSTNSKATAKDETTVTTKTQLDWRAEPPPVRSESPSPNHGDFKTSPPPIRVAFSETPQAIVADDADEKILIAKPFAPPAKPIRHTVDAKLVHELAEESEEATSNLATLDAVIERVDQTRVLLHAWDRAGKQFKCANKKVTPKETEAFATRLDQIARTMQTYPAFLGHPGKPGYRVVVQARLRMPLAMVRGMSSEQKEELLFDWQAGRQVLLAHRKYLRRLFRSMRHRSTMGLVLHAIRSVVNDHPVPTLVGSLFLAVLIISGVCAWMCTSK